MKYFSLFFLLVVFLAFCAARDGRCSLPIESGICFGYVESYGFDVTTDRCRKFVYGGCQGNDNRFGSIEACEAAC